MAKTLEVLIPTGITATAKLFTIGSDTVAETIGTLTEATNRRGTATGTVTVTGWHKVIVFSGSSPVGDFVVYVGSDDPATYTAVLDTAIDWNKIQSPTATVALTNTTIATTQKVDIETIKTNPVVNAGTVTFPTTATLASTTNITAGTITSITGVTFPSVVAGASPIRYGVALSNLTLLMTLSRSPVTGATVSSTIKKDGGAFGSTTNSVSEVGNGIYVISLTAAEMQATVVTLRFTATGCDDLEITLPVATV